MKKETKTATQTAVPEKPAAPERVHGLDLISKYRGAIMGFAALWILFFHEWVTLFVNNQVGVNIEGYLKRIGFCGVDIFLLLSGIGLTFAIRKGNVLTFYYRRIKRILLPFLVMAIIRCALEKWPIIEFWKNISGINFYTKSIYSFLWFVPAILTLYLSSRGTTSFSPKRKSRYSFSSAPWRSGWYFPCLSGKPCVATSMVSQTASRSFWQAFCWAG